MNACVHNVCVCVRAHVHMHMYVPALSTEGVRSTCEPNSNELTQLPDLGL